MLQFFAGADGRSVEGGTLLLLPAAEYGLLRSTACCGKGAWGRDQTSVLGDVSPQRWAKIATTRVGIELRH